ncbi:biopolymer transporter ExbD [Alteromonas sp. 009811495]|uniref:biopolymer transporter ExbD n=1 Tax=Alteromonas sp. 009811495 TaxID=3002962 RepID=UPI00237E7BA9|nr:biopolymer transporter ExbD [Alteromonas sp. 009811495]WDT85888.1 biopolymer transporter ExbD [Alteromonas sp. 009811495]
MLGRRKRLEKADAELDITSFLNLMIVLVPVLLMMMVFSRITVVELKLPDLSALGEGESIEQQHIELVVTPQGSAVYFPSGYLVSQLPVLEDANTGEIVQDWDGLQQVLKQLKQTLLAKNTQKEDIVLMVSDNVDYQTLITLLSRTRSYKDVVAASVVDAALFPEVSFAEVPEHMAQIDWSQAKKPEYSATQGETP